MKAQHCCIQLKSTREINHSVGDGKENFQGVTKCFKSKITAIQESKELSKVKLDEMVASTMIHEAEMKTRESNEADTEPKKSFALSSKEPRLATTDDLVMV